MTLFKKLISNNVILRNFSILTLSNILTQFLNIFASIKIARSLDPTIFGTYNLLQLHTAIFAVIASLGLRNIIIRSIARDRKIITRIFYASFLLRIAAFLLSIAVFWAYTLFHKQYSFFLFFLVAQNILSIVLFDLFESISYGLEKMEVPSIINLVSTVIWIFAILLLPKNKLTLHLIFSLFVLFSALKTIIYFTIINKEKIVKDFNYDKIRKDYILNLSKECFPYYYLSLFTLLSNQIPLLFLEYRSGVAQIGFFNIASKLLMPLNLVINTALAAIFPNLARLFAANYEVFIKNVKLIFILLTLFSITGAFSLTLFRQELIRVLYGEQYSNSGLVLGYQGWYVALYSLVCLIGTILSAINRQNQLGYLSILCTIIQVPILWYGSKFGAQYLSAAFLIATAINFIIHLFVINSFLRNGISINFFLKVTLLFVFGYCVSLLIPVTLNCIYKIIILIIAFTTEGYFLYKEYENDIKKEIFFNIKTNVIKT